MRGSFGFLGCVGAVFSLAFGCNGEVSSAGAGTSGGGGASSSNTTSTSGTSSTSSTASTSSGVGGGPHGDCQSDQDCGGSPCVPLTPGGYTVCLSFPNEATECQAGGSDLCCNSADCEASGGGKCYYAADLQFCGGAYPGFNVCVSDACASDADCAQGPFPALCAPAGVFGLPVRSCIVAYCHSDADCTAQAGGACLLVGSDPCCNHPNPDGLGCVYPGDCATDADCPNGECNLDSSGKSACGPEGPGCPP